MVIVTMTLRDPATDEWTQDGGQSGGQMKGFPADNWPIQNVHSGSKLIDPSDPFHSKIQPPN